jgi:hypothetical protein
MSAPFVASLRSRPGTIRVGDPNQPAITIRVQVPEVWDVVRIEAPASTPVSEVKLRALEALLPDEPATEPFVLKLHGFEVLDERASLEDAGAVNGSIFLLTSRRRRPVR